MSLLPRRTIEWETAGVSLPPDAARTAPASQPDVPPLRVGIDVSRAAGRPTGVGHYILSLVAALARVDRRNRYTLHRRFWDCFPDDASRLPPPPGANMAYAPEGPLLTGLSRAWRTARRGADDLAGDADVFHAANAAAPPFRRIPLVVTVQDASCLVMPQVHTRANVRLTLRGIRGAIRRAARVIVPSEATRRDLTERMGADPARLRVVPLAPRVGFAPTTDRIELRRTLARFGIDRNFILFAGAIEPRKNVAALARAFGASEAFRNGRYLLVLAGPRGWKTEEIDAALARIPPDRLRLTGYVTDAELTALYTACRLFVYPSLYEGFGLPVLEAMACGAPVVTSNVSSLPEVAGDAALLVDPRDAGALAEAIDRVLADDALRGDLRARGQARARHFHWDRTARLTLAVYEEAAREGR